MYATPKQALAELYAMRWHVQLDLRAIKTAMQMDILRCKRPAMVEKEIAAHLLAYNLVRAVMAQAAHLSNLLPRQLSFKTALQLRNAFETTLRHGSPQRLAVRCAELLRRLGRRRLPHRPHRVEPRARSLQCRHDRRHHSMYYLMPYLIYEVLSCARP